MRKVKIAAIQPNYLIPAEPYNCIFNNYRNIPDEIVESHIKKQLDVTFRLLEKAGQEGCDIVPTSEDMSGLGDYLMDISDKNVFNDLLELTVPLVESRLSAISKKYSMYIIGCYYKRINGKNYNVAVIFDRKGAICGEYRKTHMPPNEKWQCVEGDSIDVFELDFGKIGICICFDIMFPECARVQAVKGAEIIFHPTLGYGWYDSIGKATLRTRASDSNIYIVMSKQCCSYNFAGNSSIVDYWGHVVADAGFEKDTIVTKEIDLDKRKQQPDWQYSTQTSGISDVWMRNLMERRPDLYSALSEPLHKRLELPDKKRQLEVWDNIKKGICRW